MNAENSCLKFHGSTIIYCPTKKEVERVANALISHGLKVRAADRQGT
jgi:superfamily II DNA helicase RecQ